MKPKYDLPTAIRIGAKIRPQGHGALRYKGLSCVIGAALEAEGDPRHTFSHNLWPEINQQIDGSTQLIGAIIFLNDDVLWTREEIADWLDMILP